MYRCEICRAVSKAGEGLRKHILYRNDGNIDREFAVCGDCAHLLKTNSLPAVIKQRREAGEIQPDKEVVTVTLAPVAPPPPKVNVPVLLGKRAKKAPAP